MKFDGYIHKPHHIALRASDCSHPVHTLQVLITYVAPHYIGVCAQDETSSISYVCTISNVHKKWCNIYCPSPTLHDIHSSHDASEPNLLKVGTDHTYHGACPWAPPSCS